MLPIVAEVKSSRCGCSFTLRLGRLKIHLRPILLRQPFKVLIVATCRYMLSWALYIKMELVLLLDQSSEELEELEELEEKGPNGRLTRRD